MFEPVCYPGRCIVATGKAAFSLLQRRRALDGIANGRVGLAIAVGECRSTSQTVLSAYAGGDAKS